MRLHNPPSVQRCVGGRGAGTHTQLPSPTAAHPLIPAAAASRYAPQAVDTDSDGKLSYDEFADWFERRSEAAMRKGILEGGPSVPLSVPRVLPPHGPAPHEHAAPTPVPAR